MKEDIYDIIGIGIGPYNLGLAALLDQTDELHGAFFDQTPEFIWHPGMLIEKMDLQVPFLADLTTFADPKSPYTFMNYLHEHNRLFPFFFHKHFEVPRLEYNHYMQWVAKQINDLYFGCKVIDVIDKQNASEAYYEVVVQETATEEVSYHKAKHIVLGTGTEPVVLDGMDGFPNEDVLHTSRYLFEKDHLLKAKHITIVGSGQSAVEVFLDLLEEQDRQDMKLTLLTTSAGLFQLDEGKFAQEVFTPEYVDYFHKLSFEKREKALESLNPIRKGVDPETLTRLYKKLYHKTAGMRDSGVLIQPMTKVESIQSIDSGYRLYCKQWQEEESFSYDTEKVVLGTGYEPNIPHWFFDRFKDKIEWEEDGKSFKVTRDYRLNFSDQRDHHFFTLTNLAHSHGAGATNLGLSVHRNVHIINTVAGKDIYRNQQDTTFQQFSAEDLL